MATATTPTPSSSPTIVGSWLARFSEVVSGVTVSSKLVITFLNNGTYLLANRETTPAGAVFQGKLGLEFASYSWNATTGALTSSTLATSGTEVGIPKNAPTTITVGSNGKLLMVTGADRQNITFDPILSQPGSIVGSWYSNDRSGGSDDIVFTFLDDLTLVVTDKGTSSRDPNGTSGVEYGTYTWDAATGAATYTIRYDTDGQWGLSNGGPRKLIVSGDQLRTFSLDGLTDNAGPVFTRVSNLQNSGPLTLTGTTAADRLTGGAINDTLTGLAGNDTLDGGAGTDTAVFASAKAGYTVARSATGFTVSSSAEGTDTLTNIERLKFSDVSLALDLSGNAGTTAKVLGAVFGREGLTNKLFVGIGLQLLDAGTSYQALMQAALAAKLGANASNTAVVNLLYTNVIGNAPGPAELALYKGLLDSGAMTQAALGVLAADTVFNTTKIDLTGLTNTGIEYLPQG